jgi:hypothetical protein
MKKPNYKEDRTCAFRGPVLFVIGFLIGAGIVAATLMAGFAGQVVIGGEPNIRDIAPLGRGFVAGPPLAPPPGTALFGSPGVAVSHEQQQAE